MHTQSSKLIFTFQVQFNEFVSKLEAMKGEQDGPGSRRPPGPDGPRDNLAPNADRPPGFGPQQKQHKNDLPFADQVCMILK